MRLGCTATAALGLAGCSRQATGLLAPVNAPEGTDRVNMVVATTRAPSEDPAMLFSGDRGEKLSYSNIVVSIPPEREVGSVQWPRSSPGNPATDFVAVSSKPLISDNSSPGSNRRAASPGAYSCSCTVITTASTSPCSGSPSSPTTPMRTLLPCSSHGRRVADCWTTSATTITRHIHARTWQPSCRRRSTLRP